MNEARQTLFTLKRWKKKIQTTKSLWNLNSKTNMAEWKFQNDSLTLDEDNYIDNNPITLVAKDQKRITISRGAALNSELLKDVLKGGM